MADIAKQTGYSVNTVSHALNNKPDISEKTKKYIVETAKKMGYIANVSAGALCLETQAFPNFTKYSQFPSGFIKNGEKFESVTEYKFK